MFAKNINENAVENIFISSKKSDTVSGRLIATVRTLTLFSGKSVDVTE
jgi:hypothetical protein